MAVLHRALLTWCLVAVFLILLTLRLDEKTEWDWFIIFIPVWIFDFKVAVFILFRIISHCKNRHDRSFMTMFQKLWYLLCVFLKVAFQILLCMKLQYYKEINWFFVMMPLWALLAGMCSEVFFNLVWQRNVGACQGWRN